jgi:hypothetical protein
LDTVGRTALFSFPVKLASLEATNNGKFIFSQLKDQILYSYFLSLFSTNQLQLPFNHLILICSCKMMS